MKSTRCNLNGRIACLVRSLFDNPAVLHEQYNIGIFREMPETTEFNDRDGRQYEITLPSPRSPKMDLHHSLGNKQHGSLSLHGS